jgi:hypothetical protein
LVQTDKLFAPTHSIIGVYYAHEAATVGASAPPAPWVQKLLQTIVSVVGSEALLLAVDNMRLSAKDKSFLRARVTTDQGNSLLSQQSCDEKYRIEMLDSWSFISSLLDALLIQKIQHLYDDFEDHMNGGSAAARLPGEKAPKDDGINSGTLSTPAADFRNLIATNFIANYIPTTTSK